MTKSYGIVKYDGIIGFGLMTKWSVVVAVLIAVWMLAAPGWTQQTTDVAEAEIAALIQKADQGDALAQNNLGNMYRDGKGVTQDDREAVKWYRLAADQGEASAQYNLGNMYVFGEGVAQDDKEAVKWFRLAADQGFALAQGNLGSMHEFGRGVTQDDKEAVKWYRLAAGQGLASAQRNLGYMHKYGRGVTKDDKEAVKWFRLAADQGEASAQYNLGNMYVFGEGVAQDDKEAVKWFRLTADQGFALAQRSLGYMHELGRGVTQDDREAVKWYRLAADQGLASAQRSLGLMYVNGKGVAQDYKEANMWWRLAADQGDAWAQGNLGRSYWAGKGVIKDYVEAYKWLVLAGMTDDGARKSRDSLKQELTASQIDEGQRLAREWQEAFEKRGKEHQPQKRSTGLMKASGSGFMISLDGYFMTAAHVVKDASRVEVILNGRVYPARVALRDEPLDVAVLKLTGEFSQALTLAADRVATGEPVITVGYSNVDIQGSEPKYTEGVISATSGLENNPRYYQISVAVQPGNSGGPLLDGRGRVVGVITSKLDAGAALALTGSLPESVNYAVKGSFFMPLLESIEGLTLPVGPEGVLERLKLIERVKKAVGLVVCY